VALFGLEDRVKRALCRAAFTADAMWVRRLVDDDTLLADVRLSDEERGWLLEAGGL